MFQGGGAKVCLRWQLVVPTVFALLRLISHARSHERVAAFNPCEPWRMVWSYEACKKVPTRRHALATPTLVIRRRSA
uniref:Putative secreted protein n=1 Tax=Anopheles triannulatus TaxID=58253 RepID=A0A2M4B126_9DIPT